MHVEGTKLLNNREFRKRFRKKNAIYTKSIHKQALKVLTVARREVPRHCVHS